MQKNNNKLIRTFQLSVLAMSIPLLAACNKETPKTQNHPLPVSTSIAKSVAVPKNIEVVAQAEGAKEVEVRARVGGILEDQKYVDGQKVNQGDILYILDKEPLQIDVDRSRAKAMEAVARTKQAMREESRLAKLYAGQAISQREYENTVSEREMAQAAQVAAKTDLKQAELNLSYATVRAPISGVVSRSEKSIGSLVTAGSDSLLTKMVQIDPIWVNFSLSVEEYKRLGLDKGGVSSIENVEAILPDGSVFTGKGKINFMDSKVDKNLSTIQLRAEFSNPQGTILPGQFVRIKLDAGNYDNAYLVPQSAVLQSDKGRFVYTVSSDNHVSITPVETGPWSGINWVITDGLKDGDQIIVDNLIKLSPGAEITLKKPDSGVTK
ncbi:MAG: efflux RND transporter periplasmic adaptor subunit [Hafnia sp.]